MLGVVRERLANGLRVVAVPLPHLHTTSLVVMAKAGPRYETAETNGLSHLVEHMLFRGTARHPTAFHLNRAIEELGGVLEGETHVDHTLYQVSLPPENAVAALALLGEMFRTPIFEGLAIEKEVIREEILEGLDEDGREVDVDELSRAQLYAPHPLGLSLTGSLENLDRFDAEDLRRHQHAHYGARNLVVAAAGPLEPRAFVAEVALHFGALAPGAAVLGAAPSLAGGARTRFVESTGSQTDVRLSFPVPGERHPDAVALQLLSRTLDDGLSSRLHRAITDESGLAYDAFCAVDLYEDAGIFDLGAAVEHEKTPAVVAALAALVRDLRDHPVPPDELDRVKRRYAWSLRAAVDDAEAVAQFFGVAALVELPDDFDTWRRRVEATTAEDLQRAARAHLRDDLLHLTTVGLLSPALEQAAKSAMVAGEAEPLRPRR